MQSVLNSAHDGPMLLFLQQLGLSLVDEQRLSFFETLGEVSDELHLDVELDGDLVVRQHSLDRQLDDLQSLFNA